LSILFALIIFLTWISLGALFALLFHLASGSPLAMTIAEFLDRVLIREQGLGTIKPIEKEGSTLVVFDGRRPANPNERQTGRRSLAPGSVARKTILCIDDDDGILSYHRELLERRGFAVVTTASARRGVQIAVASTFAAVIIDYNMPEMNGHEVATEIKRVRPQVPIVMVSGEDQLPEDAVRLVDAVVPKEDVHVSLLPVLTRICAEG
jgi:CheY-like chemotaxis protein